MITAARLAIQTAEGDPFHRILETMVTLEFPGAVIGSPKAQFESIVTELIGTKQHRYGPSPDPESLVEIRDVVRSAMKAGRPIPILIPWGSSKQGPFGVDIAELMALKQLQCLDLRIRAHYDPGVEFAIRLEDLTDDTMFAGIRGWEEKTAEYKKALRSLHNIMRTPHSEIFPESVMMQKDEFRQKVEDNTYVILEALRRPAARGEMVRRVIPEWSGELPDEQLNYYRAAYDKFYPDDSESTKDTRLATYFAAAISRFQLKGTGVRPEWEGKYLTLSFTGIPWGKVGRRLYYRTIPVKYTNQHRAPWIGKGYVRISKDKAMPAIVGWNGDDLDYVKASLLVENPPDSVEIEADYVVMD